MKENSAYPLIMWSIDTLDWKTLDPVQTVENTMAAVKDGSIVLMHDIHAETVTGGRIAASAADRRGLSAGHRR